MSLKFRWSTAFGAAVFAMLSVSLPASERVLPDPAAGNELATASGTQTAVFAGGCFWCTEAVFEPLAGVRKVVSGYTGGTPEQAHYEIVSAGRSTHAESIEITFDPSKISYGRLLRVFFEVAHDPTQLNRQGPDYGKQYRSAIFYASPEQQQIVEAYIKQLTAAKVFDKPVVTQVNKLERFYPAEGYHQDFVKNNPTHPYVLVNAIPKLQKLKKHVPDLLKSPPKKAS